MEPITTETIKAFLLRLGENYPERASFYLLGGGALCLLGSPRQTMDLDYTMDLDIEHQKVMEEILNRLADEYRIDVESVPIEGLFRCLPEQRLAGSLWADMAI